MNLFAQAEPDRAFNQLLIEARLRNKFTVETLAMKLGCPPGYYAALEEGARLPGLKWIPRLSRTLSIPLDQLKDAADTARDGKTHGR